MFLKNSFNEYEWVKKGWGCQANEVMSHQRSVAQVSHLIFKRSTLYHIQSAGVLGFRIIVHVCQGKLKNFCDWSKRKQLERMGQAFQWAWEWHHFETYSRLKCSINKIKKQEVEKSLENGTSLKEQDNEIQESRLIHMLRKRERE